MSLNDPGYVVESEISRNDGAKGTARLWVGTRGRALELVKQGHEAGVMRTFREVPISQMPTDARDNLLRARREARAHLRSI